MSKEIELRFSEETRHKLFPISVYAYQLEEPNFLDEYATKLRDMQQEGVGYQFSERNWCSPDNLNELDDWALIKNLVLDRTAKSLLDLHIKFDGLRVNCMWANIHKTGSSHQLHNHPNCMYSGVMYLSVPEGLDDIAGDFFFKDPVRQAYQVVYDMTDGHAPTELWNFKPKKGLIIIFPSWLEHGVNLGNFAEDKDRISLSFNIMVESTMTQHNTIRAQYR